jgi:hypothetical protein
MLHFSTPKRDSPQKHYFEERLISEAVLQERSLQRQYLKGRLAPF